MIANNLSIGQGMVLLDPVQKPRSCHGFWAEVFLLFHTTSIAKRFQATVYIANVIQTAVIEDMNKVHIRKEQRWKQNRVTINMI